MSRPTGTDDSATVQYLLTVIKHTDFKPDFHKVATELGLANANIAQKKFRKNVLDAGFDLVKGQVVANKESSIATATTAAAAAAPTTPKKKATSKPSVGTPTSPKKRKVEQAPAEGEDDLEGATNVKIEE